MNAPPKWNGIFPPEITDAIRELGRKWNSQRLRFDPKIEGNWDKVIDEWAEASDIPLIIRKSSGLRGSEKTHDIGRKIIISDNSPAQWVCHLALSGIVPTIEEIRRGLIEDTIPISFAVRKEEKSLIIYHQALNGYSINKLGWKLCHKLPVGIGNNEDISTIDIDTVIERFKRLMKPSNFFLIPKEWGGLGELQEFIDEMH